MASFSMRIIFPGLLAWALFGVPVPGKCSNPDIKAIDDSPKPVGYRDLLELVDIGAGPELDDSGLALSPDGTALSVELRRALVAENKTEGRWHVIPLSRPTTGVVDVGSSGEPIVLEVDGVPTGQISAQRPRWSPDSQWIAYRRRDAGEIQIWRSRRDGSKQEKVTANRGLIEESFEWSSDGKRILYTVNTSLHKRRAKDEYERATGYIYDHRFSPFRGGSRPLVPGHLQADEITVDEITIWVHDLQQHVDRVASPSEIREFEERTGSADLPAGIESIKHSSDGNLRAWLEDRASGAGGVTPPMTVVASKKGVVGAIVCADAACTGRFKGLWAGDDGCVYFLRWVNSREYGDLELLKWHVYTNMISRVLKTSDLLESCSLLRRSLVCSHESAVSPRKIVTVDLERGDISSLFDPNPRFASLILGEVRPMTWSDKNGVEGFGHLVLPIGYTVGKQYPLIIVQYRSRGFLRGGTGDEYPIHAFAARGYVVLSFHRPEDWESYALSDGADALSQRMWEGFRDKRRVLSVLQAAIEKLGTTGIIDRKRVGLTGLSDGAETAAYALIHDQNRFAAASVSSTFWNPILYYLAGERLQKTLGLWGLGDPALEENLTAWREISIALNAQSLATPILIQVADQELLPETQTFTALASRGRAAQLYVFDNEFHIKTQPAHRSAIYRRNIAWFDFWLRNIEDRDLLPDSEYLRWRALRRARNLYGHDSIR